MSLIRIGPVVLDLDDVRAIVEEGPAVVVTFRDGTSLTLGGAQAEAVRRFVLNLPDGIPLYGPDDAASGRVGRPDVAPVQRKEGN
jgi:hypothetical protein